MRVASLLRHKAGTGDVASMATFLEVLRLGSRVLMGAGSSNLCDDLLGLAPPPEQSFTVQGKQYASIRLLGEGGYAFVFLVRDDATGRMYALKKARVAAAAFAREKDL